ncbi:MULTISPECIES: hypothetical protein [Bacillus cereus group]|uniref:hypothetical protein n=1 Tax=Bacillus cereus group TaxID=86661 RepID=UPI0005CE086E|nr:MULTISPECIES: hypothetical protein [Bacillus cereus group]MDK7446685.1 hypothetical protein [Bacillus paranthracis]MDN8630718.1 hypothetical protein [Bacillus paranthracis]MDN8637843.1 hypothetical protein [Bacillus paranthracis]HDR7855140.1 hypothetical protein [Bacillus paranthracis]
MKKIVLGTIGFAFTLSILGTNTFSATTLNKGDGGAPARPDFVLAYYGDYPSSTYSHGEGWISDGNGGGVSKEDIIHYSHADHF